MVSPVKLKPRPSNPKVKRPQPTVLETLIRLEGEAIAAKDVLSLQHQAVNRPRAMLECGHIFWVSRSYNAVKILAVTGQEKMERHTPFGQWLESELKSRVKKGELDTAHQWQFQSRRDDDSINYPFTHAHLSLIHI